MTDPPSGDHVRDQHVEPVELRWRAITVRGYRWAGDPTCIVLLHDAGDDLDVWGDVPAALAADGYTVLSLDLPGHGLSDDPWEPDRLGELISFIARTEQASGCRRCFVMAAGSVAMAAVTAEGLDAAVALSPQAPDAPTPGRTPPTLVLVGGADTERADSANRFFRSTRGWAVVSSFGTDVQSAELYRGAWGNHALEQTLAFFRDYRWFPKG